MNADSSYANFEGWAKSYVPIVFGEKPPHAVTLAALADREIFAAIVPRIANAFGADTRYASLTLLHYAIGAVMNLLVAPFALNAVTMQADASQLGFVVADNGMLTELWASPQLYCTAHSTTELGWRLARILQPIVSAAQQTIPLKGRGVQLVMYDAVYRGCQTLERAHDIVLENGWIEKLLAAMGQAEAYPYRTFMVQPDAGAPVEMTIPRVCCVLAPRAAENACPMCPKYIEAQRIQMATAWLRSLDDAAFRQVTGRAKFSFVK